MIDPWPLWDFSDPAASETRFRAAAEDCDSGDRLVLLTQVARALGLQERYDEAHEVLDALSATDDEAATRIALERGRLLRSSGVPDAARPHFEAAEQTAGRAGLDALQVDALHMVALVVGPREQVAVNDRALALARVSADPRARDWDASLLNNIGMAHADAGDFPSALAAFEEAVVACERIGEAGRLRVARWMVAWALRNLGRHGEALTRQRQLKAELDAAGESDPYVEEELEILEG